MSAVAKMSASPASIDYEKLERVLLVGRSMGFFGSKSGRELGSEDRLLDRMDSLWGQMTEEERADADARSVALKDVLALGDRATR